MDLSQYRTAELLIQERRYDEACKVIQQGLTDDKNPDKHVTLLVFASEMFNQNQYKSCIELCELSNKISVSELATEGIAKSFIQLRDFQSAIDAIFRYYNPKFLDKSRSLLKILGSCYAALDQYKKGVKYFKLALINGDFADEEIIQYLLECYYDLKQYEKVICLGSISNLQKPSPRICMLKGMALNRVGSYEMAVESFSGADDLKCQDSSLFQSEFGYALMMMGKYNKALPILRSSVGSAPTSVSLKYYGWCLFLSRQFINSCEVFNASFEANPKLTYVIDDSNMNYEIHILDVRFRKRVIADACNPFHFSDGINKSKDSSMLGWFYYISRSYIDSIQYFQESLACQDNFEDYNGLGRAYYSSNNYELAIKSLTRSIELERHWNSFYFLGKAFLKSGQFESATQCFKSSLEIKPSWHSYNGLGFSMLKSGDFFGAIDAFKNSLNIFENCESFKGLGFAFMNISSYSNAIQVFQCSLEFCADHEVYLELSRAYEAIKDSGSAERARELSNLFKSPILYLN